MPKRLFGTSGIRGLIDEKLTPLLAVKVALAFAAFLGNSGSVAVGMDARLGSPMIKSAVVAGLLAGGVNVVDFGIASTPAILHATKRRLLKGAVAVTGSHTPPEIHGILLFKGDTAELFEEEEEKIEELVLGEGYKLVDLYRVGHVSSASAEEPYVEDILDAFGEGAFKGYKVVLDAGHSPAVHVLTRIFEQLGCSVTVINGDVNGRFPRRPPNPLPQYLDELRRTVVREKADFGIAIDGDGDRDVFVDEQGNVVTPDYMGALFAKYELLKRKGTIVCPVNTSSVIEYVVRKYGGRYIFTKVGPPAMAEALVKTSDAIFAFEETGKYIWPQNIYYGDPAYATGRLLQLISEHAPLSQLISEFPVLFQEKIAIPCPDHLKGPVLSVLLNRLKESENVKLILIDGVKAIFENGDWILLRPSGTEPVFRCFIETSNPNRLESLKEYALKLVKEAMSTCSSQMTASSDNWRVPSAQVE